jgi:hypothetical protein
MPKASPYSDSHAIWRSDETTVLCRVAEMIETLTFRDQVESVRPPGAAKRETKGPATHFPYSGEGNHADAGDAIAEL